MIFKCHEDKRLVLRSIIEGDIELLRKWKNSNRKKFFFQDVISKESQKTWFKEFSSRDHDYMLIIKFRGISIGSFGFRVISKKIDLYNLMLIPSMKGRGIMALSLKCALREIKKLYGGFPITASVLKSNKSALKWYLNNNFVIDSEYPYPFPVGHYYVRYLGI